MELRLNLLLAIFCALLGVGHGFVPRRNLGKPHIMGGNEVDIAEMPYMAAIKRYLTYHCGASIIGKYYALTGAHCFLHRSNSLFYGVIAGASDINQGKRHFVRSIDAHPKFVLETSDYDVAVVRVWFGFEFGAKLAPIVPVDIGSTLSTENKLLVAGWGETSDYALNFSDKLLKTEVQYIDREICQKTYDDNRGIFDDEVKVLDRLFCAGTPEGYHDACSGDLGGPIIDSQSGKQVGIVAWRDACVMPTKPGLYTSLSDPEIRQFVDEKTKNY